MRSTHQKRKKEHVRKSKKTILNERTENERKKPDLENVPISFSIFFKKREKRKNWELAPACLLTKRSQLSLPLQPVAPSLLVPLRETLFLLSLVSEDNRKEIEKCCEWLRSSSSIIILDFTYYYKKYSLSK